jgi:hypothetical protein
MLLCAKSGSAHHLLSILLFLYFKLYPSSLVPDITTSMIDISYIDVVNLLSTFTKLTFYKYNRINLQRLQQQPASNHNIYNHQFKDH